MIFAYLIIAVIGLSLCYAWVKFVFFIFKLFKPKPKEKNPYIEAQKIINENDEKYQEYLLWMQSNGGGVPMQKLMTKEEFEVDREIKRLTS